MAFLIDVLLFFVGAAVIMFFLSVTALPLLYGFPRSTFWAVRGRAPWRAPVKYLLIAIVWLGIWFGVSYAAFVLFPNIGKFLYNSVGFFFGQWAGIFLFVGRIVFSRSARSDLNDDFSAFVEETTGNSERSGLAIFGLFTYPKRLNNLFCDAVNVWMLHEDQDALEIAVNACLTAADKQRASMLAYASTAADPIEIAAENTMPGASELLAEYGGLHTIKERLAYLVTKVNSSMGENLVAARKNMKPENERAVAKGDTQFFRRRYPDFVLWDDQAAS